MKLTALFAALSIGCTGGNFVNLPEADRARFNRCENMLKRAQCPTEHDALDSLVSGNVCLDDLAARYADDPDRRAWLIAMGCPPAMVNAR